MYLAIKPAVRQANQKRFTGFLAAAQWMPRWLGIKVEPIELRALSIKGEYQRGTSKVSANRTSEESLWALALTVKTFANAFFPSGQEPAVIDVDGWPIECNLLDGRPDGQNKLP